MPSGRLTYDRDALERLGESLVRAFLRERHGAEAKFPILTQELVLLLETKVDGVSFEDQDVAKIEPAVEGLTEFHERPARPFVRIAAPIGAEPIGDPRLRFTIAHELAHVIRHDPADSFDPSMPDTTVRFRSQYHRLRMESEADYLASTILMPGTEVVHFIGRTVGWDAPIPTLGPAWSALCEAVATGFGVSHRAAQIRLNHLGVAVPHQLRLLR